MIPGASVLLLIFVLGRQSPGFFPNGLESDDFGDTLPTPVVAANDAVRLRDGTPVTLSGHIRKDLGKDLYLFQDAKGVVTVRVRDWNGLTVYPTDRILVKGTIESGGYYSMYSPVYVDVQHLRKR